MIDAIYWRLHSSYLMNERSEADRYMAMLEDEIGTEVRRLEDEVGFIHAERFLKMRDRMAVGEYGRIYGPGASLEDLYLSASVQEKSGPEKAFCKELSRSCAKFLSALDIEFWATMASELVMEPYGRCDFVAREGRRLHVIEVKMGEAPSSVASQIDKYRLGAELDMCLGLYDEVLAYVLAESFSPYVASELSRLGVAMYEHRGNPETLRRVSCQKSLIHRS